MPRSRTKLAALLAATVALGLASRRWPLPGVFAEYTGDGLYAVAAFWALALVAPGARGGALALAAFGASGLVELAQLVHGGWLDAVRATRVGGLLLGHGFQVADLVAYGVGAVLAWGADRALLRNASPSPLMGEGGR
jgi:hypothetical protein